MSQRDGMISARAARGPGGPARPRLIAGLVLAWRAAIPLVRSIFYAGEIKKSMFTITNHPMPLEGVMSMHCSANVGKEGAGALFFGLSGTGQTTRSTDPARRLIGSDEHARSDAGIFNYENGCYAEGIAASASAEPQICACTRRVGPVLETEIDLMREPQITFRRFVQNFKNFSEGCPPEVIAAGPQVT